MIRRTPVETKINHERWLVSYADFVTLLFAFFVVMYSVSQVNESKYRTLSATLQSAFEAKSVSLEETREGQDTFELGSLEDIFAQLQGEALEFVDTGLVTTRGNEDWVEIELNANLLFVSGSADLNPAANEVLEEIAEVLLQHKNAIAIEGHTDNVPISGTKFSNNWQLSAARAVSVLDFIAFQGVQPSQLSAVGFGEYRPVADNASEEGRSKNRRVVIRVANHVAAVNTFDEQETSEVSVTPGGSVQALEPQIESSDLTADAISPSASLPRALQPVRLEGGGILFSSDPDLPRNNAPVVAPLQ